MLIIKRLKEGYTYQKAYSMIKNDCSQIKEMNRKVKSKNRKKKRITKEVFMKGLINPTNRKE